MALSVNDVCVPVRRILRANRSNHKEALLSPTPLSLHAKESNNSFGGASRLVAGNILSWRSKQIEMLTDVEYHLVGDIKALHTAIIRSSSKLVEHRLPVPDVLAKLYRTAGKAIVRREMQTNPTKPPIPP
jgi:hypothetical protein